MSESSANGETWNSFAYAGRKIAFCDIAKVAASAGRDIDTLPFAARVFLENVARQAAVGQTGGDHAEALDALIAFDSRVGAALPLAVPRVVLPDSSGIPALQDLASLRTEVGRAGLDPRSIEPGIPVDLVVDHSIQVDFAGSGEALARNVETEFQRNDERYRFLKWADRAFSRLRVLPPGTGIIHQVNLEYLARVVLTDETSSPPVAYPDFVLGGDSHTTMVNGIGVLGWGVGGVDAVTALLGLSYTFALPEIVGVHLRGAIPPGAIPTDAALMITERLRRENVTACIIEYFGDGATGLSIPDRATIANMAPEYGATAGYFPVDDTTIAYLALSRGQDHAAFVEQYCRSNNLYRAWESSCPRYSRIINIDLSEACVSVAGPRRPQDRLMLDAVSRDFSRRLPKPLYEGGFSVEAVDARTSGEAIGHGSIVIASITSCTNTSNPTALIAAGLVAKKAAALGLKPPRFVRTSLAPGSRAVTRYLTDAGLMEPLEALGFHVVGYGCTVCAGKSGPLQTGLAEVIEDRDLVVASVLSGNRNFPGRIHRHVRANYIMSPPLVVAYALAGRVDIDLSHEPLGTSSDGEPIVLADLWPSPAEIGELLPFATRPGLLSEIYAEASDGNAPWRALDAPHGDDFPWDAASQYLVESPFVRNDGMAGMPADLHNARVLGLYGDSLTTDHISPSGEIPPDSASGRYLVDHGVRPEAFNTFVARRGNPEVMVRATFANIRILNRLVPDREGGWTRHFPDGEVMSVYEAAMAYQREGTPMVVVAGREYGTGSSRDWAAKGPALLGVQAVIAGSFERIHRANLVAMGIVPLRLNGAEGWQEIGITGEEMITVQDLRKGVLEHEPLLVTARRPDRLVEFEVMPDVLTQSERDLLAEGGMFPRILNRALASGKPRSAP